MYLCRMNIPKNISAALEKQGIRVLNDMQLAACASLKERDELILLAPTGSGKTLGFLLPLLDMLDSGNTHVQALIITPTRELALQIEQVFKNLGTAFKVNTTYGGHSMQTERHNFLHPPAVLIGTPGRLTDHLRRENIDLSQTKALVLDEFDKSLEMGFQEDMAFIIRQLTAVKQRILVSATDLDEIPAFTGILNAVKLNFLTVSKPEIQAFRVIAKDTEKPEVLLDLLCGFKNESAIIFCNHRDTVERISDFLTETGVVNVNFHGGLEQDERERALIKFRNGSADYLVTTDLAARGLDIPEIPHVIHYQLPHQEAAFVHRNGRTARQGASGTMWIIHTETDRLPDYLPEIPLKQIPQNQPLPHLPNWKTLYFGGGKKDKINKVDIVGFLSKIGQLKPADIGLISVLDYSCLVAVRASSVNKALPLIRDQKIKGKKIKIGIAR